MITPMPVEELFPDIYKTEVSFKNLILLDESWFKWSGGGRVGLKFYQLYFMCALIKQRQYERIFEFGTDLGKSALQFAVNSPETGTVYTIGLPEEMADRDKLLIDSSTHTNEIADLIPKSKTGKAFRGTEYEKKIVQFYGDSTTFDFSSLKGGMDFIYVDGGHKYDVVMSDARNALEMLGDKGVIIFDDYDRVKDVRRALDELSNEIPLLYLCHNTEGEFWRQEDYHSYLGVVMYQRGY
jgi:predicted O-methyltransferase YrrM